MKSSSREDLEIIIKLICDGDCNRRDIKLMLFEIREFLDNNSILLDIANCIHSTRIMGNAFIEIEKCVNNFRYIAIKSGPLVVEPIYNSEELVTELINSLIKLKFVFDVDAIRTRTPIIIRLISEYLDETRMAIKNDEVGKCYLKFNKKYGLTFYFSYTTDINGALRIPKGIPIAMPFFSDTKKMKL